eukprot:1974297-Pyramimonas_sp.AAC.1
MSYNARNCFPADVLANLGVLSPHNPAVGLIIRHSEGLPSNRREREENIPYAMPIAGRERRICPPPSARFGASGKRRRSSYIYLGKGVHTRTIVDTCCHEPTQSNVANTRRTPS